jgi:hypothetical protein
MSGYRGFAGVWTILVGLVVVMAACTLQAGSDRNSVPVRTQQVAVRMVDHRYVFDERGLQPGRVSFRVANRGESTHNLVLLAVPDDVDDVEAWVKGGFGVKAPVYRMADREPGERAVFAAELARGHYAMLCFAQNDDGTVHYKHGMVADFRVGSSGRSSDPSPKLSPSQTSR